MCNHRGDNSDMLKQETKAINDSHHNHPIDGDSPVPGIEISMQQNKDYGGPPVSDQGLNSSPKKEFFPDPGTQRKENHSGIIQVPPRNQPVIKMAFFFEKFPCDKDYRNCGGDDSYSYARQNLDLQRPTGPEYFQSGISLYVFDQNPSTDAEYNQRHQAQ